MRGAMLHDGDGTISGKKILMLGEFRTFIARGNVLDLAVAVIIGALISGGR